MRFDHLLYGFLLFALVIVGGTMILDDIQDNYPSTNVSTDKFSGVYNKIDDITNIADVAQNKTLVENIDESNAAESMIRGSYSGITMITGTIPLFINITNTISQEIGVPPIVPKVAIIAFGIFIIFGIIYLIFRYKA